MKFIHLFRCNIPLVASKQLWRTMRILMVIMTAFLMQVSASTRAQQFTLKSNNTSLRQVFTKIRKQTGYNVLIESALLDKTKPLNVDLKNASLADALKSVLEGQNLEYKINNKSIIISEKEKSLIDKVVDYFTNIDVTGKLVDENGQPIAGASIKVKGTSSAVISNNDGVFLLHNVNENSVLEISYLGYQIKEVKVSKDLGSIKLELSIGKLDEVTINAGYYSVTDRERTGSISKVTAKDIEKQPVNNPLMALQNRVTGLQITQQTGIPGGGFTVQIRGKNSINNGNDPLYIVDGVNYPSTRISNTNVLTLLGSSGASPLSLISPNDIESIEILKDADATAIYGSKGSNGVILITTKRGKEGKTKIIAGISQGFSRVAKFVDLLNTEQFVQMRKEALSLDGIAVGSTDYDINGTWDQTKHTNWQEELIGGNSETTNASVNISGGTLYDNYSIAANYYKEGTVFPGDFGFDRIGIRSNINLGSKDNRFRASLTTNFNHSKSDLSSTDLTSNIFLAPNQPDSYDQYGQLTWSNNTVFNNPMALAIQTYSSKTDEFLGNLTLSYEIFKNFNMKTTLGYSTIRRQELRKRPLSSINPALATYVSATRLGEFGNNFINNFLAEPILSYKARLGIGTVDGLVGLSLQDNVSELAMISASNFTSDDLLENISSAAIFSSSNTSLRYRYSALFARLNYSVMNKYYLNVTARRDGSTKFGPGNQFANFGAIGAAWIFSDEGFIKQNLSFLSYGKLRTSYGITGNDQISDYNYLQLWNSGTTYQGSPTITPNSAAPNADFAWETNKKFEIGLQLGLLKDKAMLEVSYYNNLSSNQLIFQILPSSTGFSSVQMNLPAKVQNTGWEFEMNLKLVNSQNLKWRSGINFTIPKNKLLSYPGLLATNVNYQIGEPLSILKTYNVTVNSQTGTYIQEDKNGNGSIDNGDRYIVKFLGQKYYGGFQNSFTFKQFNLDVMLSFTKQNVKNFAAGNSQAPGTNASVSSGNQIVEVLSRWQKPGDQSLIQRFGTTSTTSTPYSNYRNFGNLAVVDGSFLRVKNIALSYSLPKTILSKLKIDNAIVSVQGQNIFTITKYVGLDPETASFSLPPLRAIMVGLNVSF